MRRFRSSKRSARPRVAPLPKERLDVLEEASALGTFTDSDNSDNEPSFFLRRHVRSLRKIKLLSRVRELPLQLCLPDMNSPRPGGGQHFEPMTFDGAAIDRIVSLAAWAGYDCCCCHIRVRPLELQSEARALSSGSSKDGAATSYAPLAGGPVPMGSSNSNGGINNLNGHGSAAAGSGIGEVGGGVLCHLLYRHHAVRSEAAANAAAGALSGSPCAATAAKAVAAAAGLAAEDADAAAAASADDESTDDESLLFHDAEDDESVATSVGYLEEDKEDSVHREGDGCGVGSSGDGGRIVDAAAADGGEKANGGSSGGSGGGERRWLSLAAGTLEEDGFAYSDFHDAMAAEADRSPSPVPQRQPQRRPLSSRRWGRSSPRQKDFHAQNGQNGSKNSSVARAAAWRATFVVAGRPYVAEVSGGRETAPVCCLLGEVLRLARLPDGRELPWSPAAVTLVDVTVAGSEVEVPFTGELSASGGGGGGLDRDSRGRGGGGWGSVNGLLAAMTPSAPAKPPAVLKVVIEDPIAAAAAAGSGNGGGKGGGGGGGGGLRDSIMAADSEDAMPEDVYNSLPPELKRSLAERRERQRLSNRRGSSSNSSGGGGGGGEEGGNDGCGGGCGVSGGGGREEELAAAAAAAAAVAAAVAALPQRPRGGPERFFCPATSIPPMGYYSSATAASSEGGSSTGNGNPRNCWEEPPGSSFKVRGPRYMEDGKKFPSAEAAYLLLGIDLLVSDTPHHEVGARENGFVQRFRREKAASSVECPFLLVLNFSLPWGSFLAYLAPRHGGTDPYVGDPKFDGLLRRMFEGVGAGGDGTTMGLDGKPDVDAFPNNRLKIVPRCHAGPWLVRQTVGGKPAIIGNKIKQMYHRGEGYFEIETDINSSMAALYILAVVKNFTEAVAVDLGFVIQGEGVEELPERLIGALRFHHLDVANAIDFDAWEARPTDKMDPAALNPN